MSFLNHLISEVEKQKQKNLETGDPGLLVKQIEQQMYESTLNNTRQKLNRRGD